MVTHLLGTEDIGNDLEELILEKTEGIPFYLEEFIKSLKDLNAIEKKNGKYHLAKDIQAVSIPSTIQDVIMARVDRLPEEAKNLLQTGSVIEREFSYKLIKTVSNLSEQELLPQLSVLKDSELIFERGIYPESTYIFKHALTQEVVYDSILSRKKKELHNKIGQSIEQLYKDNLHEHYGVLAEHFIIGENYKKGSDYCRLAAKKAEKAGVLDDSIAYGEKQVFCLERMPQTEKLEKDLIDARTTVGIFYSQLSHMVESKTVIDPIVNLAKKRNYEKRLSHLNIILGLYYYLVEEDITIVFHYLEKALKIGKKLNDLLSLVLANTYLGICLFYNCEFSKALYYFEKALEINIKSNALWGISALKAWIAKVHIYLGKVDLGHKTSQEALRIADESGDIYSKAHAYTAHGWVYYIKGYFKKAEIHLRKGVDFSERINQLWWAVDARFGLGMTYFEMDEYKLSQKQYEKAISLGLHGVSPSVVNYFKTASVLSKVMNNEIDVSTNEIFKCYHDRKINMAEVWMLSFISEILLNIDDQHISEAEDWIKRSIDTHMNYAMMWHLARDYALYAELFKRKEDFPKVKENLTKAIEIFKECGADGWVEKYEKELAAL
jgi:tetratricopeptide (TPR) repeat protein